MADAPVTNVIITDDDEHGPTMESPQLPGFFFGRPTSTEFRRDYRTALGEAGVQGVVLGHRQQRFTVPEGQEYLVRFAEAGDRDARVEAVDRLHQVLTTEDRHQLLDAPRTPMGEVVFVAVLPDDTLGDLMDQMYEHDDALVMVAAVADSGIFTSAFAAADRASHPGWQSAADRGWDRDTTVGRMMQDLASCDRTDRRLLV